MLKIGLTGGIGSGKTAISDAFKTLGTPIIDTDIIAREVFTTDKSLLSTLINTFGTQILNNQNHLDRSKLREIAFLNKTNKEKLDNIMHPSIRHSTLKQIQDCEKLNPPYCIIVVPLLIETGFINFVDRVLVVTAPIEKKLLWLEKRSQLDAISAKKIISKQSSDEEKLSHADDVIHNTSSLDNIQTEVLRLHQHYVSLTKN